MKKKQGSEHSAKDTVFGLLIIVVIVLVLFRACSPKKKDAGTEIKIDKSAPAIEQLTTAFELSGIKGDDVKIVSSDDGYHVMFDYAYTIWDETDFIGKSIGAYVAYCDLVYKETDITGIKFYIFGNMIDKKGNSRNEKMFVMSMPKENFLTYNWENLEYVDGTYTTIEKDCTELFIVYGVRSRADLSKVHISMP